MNGAINFYKIYVEKASRMAFAEIGWAGRIRTFDTGSKGRGLTAWRPPILNPAREARSVAQNNQLHVMDRRWYPAIGEHLLIFRDYFLLEHSACLVIDWMRNVLIRSILALFAGHRDKQPSRAMYNF